MMFFRTNIDIITLFFTFLTIFTRHCDCRPDGALSGGGTLNDESKNAPPAIVNPIMKTQSQDKFANLGDEIIFPCEVINGDQQRMSIEQLNWMRRRKSEMVPLFFTGIPMGANDDMLSHITLDGTSIVIKPVKSTDTGQYVCEVADINYKNVSVKHHLAINAPPTIQMKPENGKVHVIRDKEVRLQCDTDVPELKWTKDGGKIDESIKLEKNALIIKKASRVDSGRYNCTAYNDYGTHSSKQFMVTVEDIPSVEIPRKVIHSGIGRAEEIVCLVQSSPEAKVQWFRKIDGKNLQITRKSSEYILSLRIQSDSDFGTYVCKADNKYGTDEGLVEINGRPAKPQILNDDTEYLTSDAFNLRFRFISYSPVKEVKMFTRWSENNGESFTDWNETSTLIPDDPSHDRNVEIPLNNLQRITYEAKVVVINDYGPSEPSDVYSITAGETSPQMATASSTRLTGVSAFLWLSLSLLAMYIGRIR